MGDADERDARIDELCEVDGPLTRGEADLLSRLAAREQRWGKS